MEFQRKLLVVFPLALELFLATVGCHRKTIIYKYIIALWAKEEFCPFWTAILKLNSVCDRTLSVELGHSEVSSIAHVM